MTVHLYHFDQNTQALSHVGFAPNAWEMIRMAFGVNPPEKDLDVLTVATDVTGELYYSRIKGRLLVYHNSLENLKGELNDRYQYQL